VSAFWRRASTFLSRVATVIVIFCLLRIAVGIGLLAFADNGAWGMEATLILAAAVVICLAVALAVRRWSPPRRAR
jgi:hypothetical protein